METIARDTLESFKPTTQPPDERLEELVSQIGVTRTAEGTSVKAPEVTTEEMQALVHRWNIFSSIGWNATEEQVISLILAEEQANKRFDGELFLHPKHGGNTGEHPLFIGLQIDRVREAAKLGHKEFDPASPKTLAAARLTQKLHSMAVLHDTGELIDISVGEMRATGASSKEPPEEKLVGPFKIKLACYALAVGNPGIYTDTMAAARERIQKRKDELLKDALDKKISGDDFVAGVGKEIAAILDENAAQLATKYGDMEQATTGKHREVCDCFLPLFDHTLPPDQQPQEKQDNATPLDRFEGILFTLFDKLEGDEHFRYFIGEPVKPHTGATPIVERMFPEGKMNSFHMASSDRVIGGITYAQKMIPLVLEAAAALPDGPEREAATAYARAGSAALLRNHIRILQKAPEFVDTTRADALQPKPADSWDENAQSIVERLEARKSLKAKYMEHPPQYPITHLSGVQRREEVIAVLDTMASAIEKGEYAPTKADLPLGFKPLPENLHVAEADVVHCRDVKHPCEIPLIGDQALIPARC